MKAAELREMTVEELAQKERELREEIFQSRLKYQSGELANTAKLKLDRRDLARVLSLKGEKQKAGAK